MGLRGDTNRADNPRKSRSGRFCRHACGSMTAAETACPDAKGTSRSESSMADQPIKAEEWRASLYQAAVQHWSHAEQVRWTLLYNYLMASTILLLAWATVFASAVPHTISWPKRIVLVAFPMGGPGTECLVDCAWVACELLRRDVRRGRSLARAATESRVSVAGSWSLRRCIGPPQRLDRCCFMGNVAKSVARGATLVRVRLRNSRLDIHFRGMRIAGFTGSVETSALDRIDDNI